MKILNKSYKLIEKKSVYIKKIYSNIIKYTKIK